MNSLSRMFPDRQELVARIARLLDWWRTEQAKSTSRMELTLVRIFDEVDARSTGELAQVLAVLVKQGILERRIRVESPSMGGIEEFHALSDVPKKIRDPYTDEILEISPANLNTIFRLA